jgi:HrpA-like RNA helicase
MPSNKTLFFFTRNVTARRISAISIAERVAQEQCIDTIGGLVGYQVRLESAVSKHTQLVFLTPGVLLRKLQSSPELLEYTHVLLDEIHEHDKYTDFLLIALRDLLPRRPDLRLVLMSATLQTEKLIDYFGNANIAYFQRHPPSVVAMEGRTFPVQEFFLEDVLQMTNYITLPSSDDDDISTSMDDLELELAKLLQRQQPGGVVSGYKCGLCGGGFTDAVDLGAHVALCDGTNPDLYKTATSGESDNKNFTGLQSSDFDDYDAYDEDAPLEMVQEHELTSRPSTVALPNGDDVERPKWDGTGEYDARGSGDCIMLSSTAEKLLERYQTMHDDEQVDTELLLECLLHIVRSSYGDGAVLVFLPGWQEISAFKMELENTPPFRDRSKYLILPLHSGINSKDQRRVLQRPPTGMRKIVLSTNIAETSLTIVRLLLANVYASFPLLIILPFLLNYYRMIFHLSWTRVEQRKRTMILI